MPPYMRMGGKPKRGIEVELLAPASDMLAPASRLETPPPCPLGVITTQVSKAVVEK